jgi:hypothetical protein
MMMMRDWNTNKKGKLFSIIINYDYEIASSLVKVCGV